MNKRTKRTIFGATLGLMGLAALPALANEIKTFGEPQYDLATVTTISSKVVDIREVPTPGPMAGLHLMAANVDIYLGPTDFLAKFGTTFEKGITVTVTGSKVKFEDKDVILVREITKGRTTLTLREDDGEPGWFWGKPKPTGE